MHRKNCAVHQRFYTSKGGSVALRHIKKISKIHISAAVLYVSCSFIPWMEKQNDDIEDVKNHKDENNKKKSQNQEKRQTNKTTPDSQVVSSLFWV